MVYNKKNSLPADPAKASFICSVAESEPEPEPPEPYHFDPRRTGTGTVCLL